MMPINHDTRQSVDFLRTMFGEDELVHLVAISPDGRVFRKTFNTSDEKAMLPWIEKHQGRSNLYFTVNRLEDGVADVKAKKSDVAAINMQHVDIDDVMALDRITAFALKPTVVIFSGGGYQAFWKLKHRSFELARAEDINKAIAKALGGDNCHNVDRIMRLPGTVNVPNEKKRAAGRVPALAYIVEKETDFTRVYEFDDFSIFQDPGDTAHDSLVSFDGKPMGLEGLPEGVSSETRALILYGDDEAHPIGSAKARFRSRSEVVWRVACDLARAGCPPETIAGVLLNPLHGVSASILEKAQKTQHAARQALRACEAVGNGWPDVTKTGAPRPTLRNTMIAFRRLGFEFLHDLFRYRKCVQGVTIQDYQGDLSDDACAVLRGLVIEGFNFDPGKENAREAANLLSLEHAVHPIRDYLRSIEWDGVPRIKNWLTIYLGAEATNLNSAIGRIVLIAAVRRVLQPGTKFDTILVLEGPQGGGKSTAVKILAGEENFADQDLLTLDSKTQMEAMEGVWVYEISELEGLSRADTNKVKSFVSRAVDQARPAYARFKEKRPRQAIFIGTTNDDKYLRDMTGNRRFWPVKVGKIDLAALARDRDQLWAEAADLAAQDESILLDESLWPAATAEQEARLEDDPWFDPLSNLSSAHTEFIGGFERVKSTVLLTQALEFPIERQQQFHLKRLAGLMRKLGWEGPQLLKFKDGNTVRGYQRKAPETKNKPKPSPY